MRYYEVMSERLANERIHRNTSVATLKALARNAPSQYARFVVADGELHAADAEAFTHHQIWSARATLRGWVHYLGDDRYSYKATGIYDMHPADDPVLRHLERAGIKRQQDALHESNVSDHVVWRSKVANREKVVRLWHNPSPRQLHYILSLHDQARAVADKRQVWAWDAYDAEHDLMIQYLTRHGLLDSDPEHGLAFIESILIDLVDGEIHVSASEDLESNPMFRRMTAEADHK